MDDLFKEQGEIGEELARLIRNYKKDSESRKNEKYLTAKLTELEGHWKKFEGNHTAIVGSGTNLTDEEYFKDKYFERVKEGYDNVCTDIKKKLEGIKAKFQEKTTHTTVEHKPTYTFDIEVSNINTSSTENGADANNEELKRLIKGQKATMSVLTSHLQDVENNIERVMPKHYYDLKMKTIDQYMSEIIKTNQQIWSLAEGEKPFGYSRDFFIETENWVQEIQIILSNNIQPTPANENCNAIKLPHIVMPIFDGDYLKWTQFKDLFVQLVHKKAMSNAEKMYYLNGNLKGEPKSLIQHLSVSNENYLTAWQILTNRYDNERLITSALLNKLLSQQSMQTETANAIKSLHDITKECMLGLRNLKLNVESWDPLVLHILVKKLDKSTRGLYEQSLEDPRKIQTMQEFLKFLEFRFQALEAQGPSQSSIKQGISGQKANNRTVLSTSKINKPFCCLACKGNHFVFNCKKFLHMTVQERIKLISNSNLCRNCLKQGHFAYACNSRGCLKCNKLHNTLLHEESKQEPKKDKRDTKNNGTERNETHETRPTVATTSSKKHNRSYVFLATAIINIKNNEGNLISCNALLDSGSQINIVTEKFAKRLGLPQTACDLHMSGIADSKNKSKKRLNLHICSKTSNFATKIDAFVLNKISVPQPQIEIDVSTWNIPDNIVLADARFNQPKNIDVLLGAEVWSIISGKGKIELGVQYPALENTSLGWIIFGKYEKSISNSTFCGMNCSDLDLEEQVKQFWCMEEPISQKEEISSEEKECESIFLKTVRRNEAGRFVVRLPFKQDPSLLGKSADFARNRFLNLERRLQRKENSDVKVQFNEFMKEYISTGHMSETNELVLEGPHNFIPIHIVFKPDSSTTKTRAVFDASAPTSNGLSYNDCLYKGAIVQDDSFSILLRFRTVRYAFTGDIEKMYRQILIDEEDQKWQLVFWRENPSQKLRIFKLRTVTYGTTPASYLATKCIETLATSNLDNYQLGASALLRCLYVDDAQTGHDNLEQAVQLRKEIQEVLMTAGFRMRKWCANNDAILEGIPKQDIEPQRYLDNSDEGYIKTLGMIWKPKSDHFTISVKLKDREVITKRTVLADIAQIYDPLGLINPVITRAKMILQDLWAEKMKWDEKLPANLEKIWKKFRSDLPKLELLKISRYACINDKIFSELHGFADASGRAYGAAIYLRSIDMEGSIVVRLLCAKSRLVPLKKLKGYSIGRLELCAAKLLAQLMDRVGNSLDIAKEKMIFWSDSQTVIAWLKNEPSKYNKFVSNRIRDIQNITKKHWHYISSEENPADLASRGTSANKLLESGLWFTGPERLGQSVIEYSGSEINDPSSDEETVVSRSVVLAAQSITPSLSEFDHRNSFKFLQRTLAYIIRWKTPRDSMTITQGKQFNKMLTVKELQNALFWIIKILQTEHFSTERQELKTAKGVSKHSKLYSLSPFLDDNGIIRVEGRLQESELPTDAKCPMILPDCIYTFLLMKQLHEQNTHVGPQTLLAITRQRFWPIKGKIIARKVVKSCTQCFRIEPQALTQKMGRLPKHRVQPARPFLNAGVDFCGPVYTHYRVRGKRPQKSYIAVFCCFATRAVHLELVTDLTTDGFLGALRRFCARRGNCQNVYCDNGTNFVGAKNQLEDIARLLDSEESVERIYSTCGNKGIQFHMSPPRGPHFGGLWEAAVKSSKGLMKKTLGNANLTYEEMETVLTEIEAVLNSRPLTPLSDNPRDMEVLTPGHFLVGEPLTTIPDHTAQETRHTLLQHWKLVRHLRQQFWERWSREYLSLLQQRYKWREQQANAEPGMMVLIKESNLPPLSWLMGRITEVVPGRDNLVRVAKIMTKNGEIKRPIHNLCPLPLKDDYTDLRTQTLQSSENFDERNTQTNILRPNFKRRKPDNHSEDKHAKRVRTGTNSNCCLASFVSLVWFSSLILPIFSQNLNWGNIRHFNTSPGIVFDHIGSADVEIDKWSLVVYYDMQPYWTERKILNEAKDKLEFICEKLDKDKYCMPITEELKHRIKVIEDNDEIIKGSESSSNSRTKRSPFDIIGTLANKLFGVLDQEYADKFASMISDVQNDDNQIRFLMKNQTSILESTLNIIKADRKIIQNQWNSFYNEIQKTNKHIQKLALDVQKEKTLQLFNMLLPHTNMILSNYQTIQSAILDVVIDAHHDKINPLLVTPYQLKQELRKIRPYLPLTLRIPGDHQSDNLQTLYSLMTIRSQLAAKFLVFHITIPLLAVEKFDLFKLIPIPETIGNHQFIIRPSTNYLLTSISRDMYIPLTDMEFHGCKNMKNHQCLCKPEAPIYHLNSQLSSCEARLLTRGKLEKFCHVESISQNITFTPMSTQNKWIFSIRIPVTINILCNDWNEQRTLLGYGIIAVNKGCTVKTPFISLISPQSYSSNVHTSFIPSVNLSEIVLPPDNNIQEIIETGKQRPSLNMTNSLDIDALSDELKNLKQRIDEPKHFQPHDIHQFVVGYSGLSLVIIITLIIIILRVKYKRSFNFPTPKPRNISNIQQQARPRFNFNVEENSV